MLPGWVVAVVVAPFVGSLLSTLVVRLPRGERVVVARSACPHCHHVLAPRDLVPLLSWLAAAGRCRHCGAPIGALYPGLELAAVAIAAWAATVTTGWVLGASCVLGWCLLGLAVIDARCGLLPDAITVPLAAAGLATAAFLNPPALRDAALGAAAGFAVFAGVAWTYRRLRRRDGLGMGDAKLLGAAGAWVSWAGLPSLVALAALGALAVSAARGAMGQHLSWGDRIAFGPYLCAATWLVWLYGPVVAG